MLRLPIATRRDILILFYPVDQDPDSEVRQWIAAEQHRFASPLRVVPLDDRPAYAEAVSMTVAHVVNSGAPAAWVIDASQGKFGIRARAGTAPSLDQTHALRIVQILSN